LRYSSSPLRISIVERCASKQQRSEVMTSGKFLPAKILDRRVVADDLFLLRRFAKGRFTLDLGSGRKNHLLLATVTGVAPYVSYIRTIRADWKKGGAPMPGEHRLFCIQGASCSWEFGYRDELEKYAAEAPWLKYVPAISRPWEDTQWHGERGR